MKIQLPTEPRKIKSILPKTMLIYSAPKVGKTAIVSQLKNSLILEFEKNGADYIEGNIMEVYEPFIWDKESKKIIPIINLITDEIKAKGKPYKYLIIDTLTKLDEWSEIYGTYIYMDKSIGKSFNRENGISGGKKIYHTDEHFETVHEMPNGYGYQYSRKVLTDMWFEKLSDCAEHVIFLAHLKDKFIGDNDGTRVTVNEINLTGQTKNIIASRVSAIAQLKAKKNQRILVFEPGNNIEAGSRCSHLQGEIVISEKKGDGTIETYWDKVFIPEEQ